MICSTIPEVKVNQGLIRYSHGIGHFLEIVNGSAIKIDGDLLFQSARIRVFPRIQLIYIVFFSHVYHLPSR